MSRPVKRHPQCFTSASEGPPAPQATSRTRRPVPSLSQAAISACSAADRQLCFTADCCGKFTVHAGVLRPVELLASRPRAIRRSRFRTSNGPHPAAGSRSAPRRSWLGSPRTAPDAGHGRVVKRTGDGAIIEFRSVMELSRVFPRVGRRWDRLRSQNRGASQSSDRGEGRLGGSPQPQSLTHNQMKEHTPNLSAVFDGLRKAVLAEE
jgi:hypothetical protein